MTRRGAGTAGGRCGGYGDADASAESVAAWYENGVQSSTDTSARSGKTDNAGVSSGSHTLVPRPGSVYPSRPMCSGERWEIVAEAAQRVLCADHGPLWSVIAHALGRLARREQPLTYSAIWNLSLRCQVRPSRPERGDSYRTIRRGYSCVVAPDPGSAGPSNAADQPPRQDRDERAKNLPDRRDTRHSAWVQTPRKRAATLRFLRSPLWSFAWRRAFKTDPEA